MSRQYKGVSGYGAGAINAGMAKPILGVPKAVLVPPGHVSIPQEQRAQLPAGTTVGLTKNRSLTLAEYSPTVGQTLTATRRVAAIIKNPSAYLHLSLKIGFEYSSLPSGTLVGSEPAYWGIRAANVNPETNTQMDMQWVYPQSANVNSAPYLNSDNDPTYFPVVPDGYEADTGANLLKVQVLFSSNNLYTDMNAKMVLVATWEADPRVSKDERDYLFAQCEATQAIKFLIRNN